MSFIYTHNPNLFSLLEMVSHQRYAFFVLLFVLFINMKWDLSFWLSRKTDCKSCHNINPSKAAMEFAWQNEKRDSYQNYCLIDFLWCLILVALEPSTTSSHYIKHTRNLSLLQLPILFWTSLYDKKMQDKKSQRNVWKITISRTVVFSDPRKLLYLYHNIEDHAIIWINN